MAQWQRICLPMQETQVRPLVWDDPLEKEMATIPVFLPGKFHGVAESDTTEHIHRAHITTNLIKAIHQELTPV